MNRVQYIDVAPLHLGQPAHVKPLDHPSRCVINNAWVLTTPVRSIMAGNKGPTFQTDNTEYRPCDEGSPMEEDFIGFTFLLPRVTKHISTRILS